MPIEYQVKVSTGGDDLVRMKIAGDITFKAFLKNVEEALSLPDDMCVDKCRYFDEDGDRILLKNEKQFKNALQEFTEKQRFKIEVHKSDIISRDQLITKVLTDYREYLEDRSKYHFGYPYNLHYDHEEIFDVMKYSINNLGDPFVESNYGVHSRRFELDVLAFFAEMWQIPEGDYWGYVTSCGTEGNLHSILCAREMQPDGVLYASKDSHYSVFKACKFYRMPYEVVASKPSGEMDYEDFSKCLNQHPGKPAIIVANIGTTVKGAVDSVDTIIKTLEDHGIPEDKRVIHCDGALYALMLPFMEQFEQVNFTKKIHSMCVSGHKFLGCPMPCGVVIARKANIEKVSERVEYLNSVDTTIMGSRNGHAPIFLWYSLQKGGFEELQKKVKLCHANARLLFTMLKDRNIKALLNDRSTTVVLSRPPEAFVKHWQLACEGEIAHVVVMPNVTVEKIVQFVGELEEAFKGTWVAYHQDGGENPALSPSVKTRMLFSSHNNHEHQFPTTFDDISFAGRRVRKAAVNGKPE